MLKLIFSLKILVSLLINGLNNKKVVIFVFNVKNITKVVCKNSWFGNLKSDGEVDGEVDGE